MLRIERKALYGDIIERIIYNTLFAAQSPDGRKLRYFTPFEDVRSYYEDDYFCCPSNFRRIVAELPQFIYFEDSEGIYVNLYNASKMKTKVGGHEVTLEQVTDYPTSEEVMIKLSSESDQPFLLRLRIPSWCRDARVAINGQIVEQRAMPGRFLEIRRQWSEDDEVRIKFPMAPRFVSGKVTQYGRAAMMRGPIVYCLNNRLNDGLLDPAARKQSIVIDPSSVSQLERDDMLRPNGTRFSAKAISIDGEPLSDRLLWFTEFIDPEGIKTYINLPKDQFDQYTRDDEFLLKDTF